MPGIAKNSILEHELFESYNKSSLFQAYGLFAAFLDLFKTLGKCHIKDVTNVLIHSIVELGLIGDESLVFLVNFSEILVPKLLIKHDLIETLLSDVLHVLFGKFSSEMLSCILNCQGLVTDIDTFLAQRFFRLLVESIANSFASG